jgi:hypothetical protein
LTHAKIRRCTPGHRETSWVVNSGVSFHVSSRKEFFSSYVSGDFGNEGIFNVVGIATICLETSMGMKLILKEVRHAPDIRLNLIYTGKVDDNAYSNVFNECQWKLNKGSLIVARGRKSCNLSVLQASISVSFVNAIKSVNVC